MKAGVLLVNLGTPDSPEVSDVRKYLTEFLNDKYVIDVPWLWRKILVNVLIVPSRAPESAKIYEEVWTEKGSPLLVHGVEVKKLLQEKLTEEIPVELAMRYQNPSIESSIEKLNKKNVEKLIVIPMYPQYAYSSTRSTIEKVKKVLGRGSIKELEFVEQFYDDQKFIEAWMDVAGKYDHTKFDKVLFSFHGMPERHLERVYGDGRKCPDCGNECRKQLSQNNQRCYLATCYQTTRSIVARMGITEDKYMVTFQSRLGKTPWIRPYSDEVIVDLAKQGVKRILMFSPSFVADCLETIVEIRSEYNDLFRSHGGEKVELVESLNENPKWIESLESMVKAKI